MVQPLTAQKIDRSKQPAPDPAPKVAFPPFEVFTLDNGLKVFYVRDQRPLVTFRMMIAGGNSRDGEVPSLADAAADLLIKGTKTRTAAQFAQQIDYVGGSVGASAAADAIDVVASGLKKHLPTILTMFADAVMNPTYPESELEDYRNEQITGLKSSKANAGFLARYAVNKVLYGNTSYGQMPSEESLSKLNSKLVKAYHDTYFVPNNATLAFVGDLSKEELKSKLEAAFKGWKPGKITKLAQPAFPKAKGGRIILVDRPASVQSSIRVVGPGPLYRDPERPKTFILNSIFGAGTGLGNRLASNLREKHAYTYTPGSGYSANLWTGTFVAQADVRNDVTDSALYEMMQEIKRIQTEPVPQDELDRNIQSSLGGYMMSLADPAVTAQRLQFMDFYGLPKDYYDRIMSVYAGTTSDDVMRLARKYMDPKDMQVVVVGKASEVKSKLERFGPVEVWNTDLVPVSSMTGAAPTEINGLSADKIWRKMLDAMGGSSIQSLKSLRTTANVKIAAMGASGTLEKVESAPNSVHEVLSIPGVVTQERFVNGKKVVTVANGKAETLAGDELDKELESAWLMPEAYVQERGGRVQIKGKTTIAGKETIAIDMVMPKSGTTTYYLDPATFLPIAQESADGQMTKVSDWKSVSGILLPHMISFEPQPGVVIELGDIKYEANVSVSPSMFEKK
jgi:predicted Zn-dependent peptidase